MPDKPSYLGLLNAVSIGESAAHEYLGAWIAVSPSPDVRAVLRTVCAREGEHGLAFAKRIDELGFQVRPKDDPEREKRLAYAGSSATDLEKMERFGLGKLDSGEEPDVFDGFFRDHSIDIQTGALLGRYIAEERDSARLLKACYQELKGAAAPSPSDDRLAALESKIDAVCAAVEGLQRSVGTKPKASTNGRAKARK